MRTAAVTNLPFKGESASGRLAQLHSRQVVLPWLAQPLAAADQWRGTGARPLEASPSDASSSWAPCAVAAAVRTAGSRAVASSCSCIAVLPWVDVTPVRDMTESRHSAGRRAGPPLCLPKRCPEVPAGQAPWRTVRVQAEGPSPSERCCSLSRKAIGSLRTAHHSAERRQRARKERGYRPGLRLAVSLAHCESGPHDNACGASVVPRINHRDYTACHHS